MTAEEAGWIMMSGGGKVPVIRSLSVTKNDTYTVPEGVDGYGPVNVSVPDRYQDGYNDGYQDGYNFASSYYENIIDDTKSYVLCIYTYDASDYPDALGRKYPNSRRWKATVYETNGLNTPLATYEGWVGDGPTVSYNGKITSLKWGMSGNYEILIITTQSYNKDGFRIDKVFGINYYEHLTHSNTSVVRNLSTT